MLYCTHIPLSVVSLSSLFVVFLDARPLNIIIACGSLKMWYITAQHNFGGTKLICNKILRYIVNKAFVAHQTYHLNSNRYVMILGNTISILFANTPATTSSATYSGCRVGINLFCKLFISLILLMSICYDACIRISFFVFR